MIAIRCSDEIEKIAESARIVGGALRLAQGLLAEGLTTRDLDAEIEKYIRSRDATPSFKGYGGFPASACISINEVVVHGIPSDRKLQQGDVVGVDVGAYKNGYHGDGAWTFPVGEVSAETERLLTVAQKALIRGIEKARVGARLGEIGHAVQSHAESHGFSVVRALVGHGIGTQLHEEPQVPNFGQPNEGPILAAGMVMAIEPMINIGGPDVRTEKDGWTVVTRDRSLSAHFEHTVAVTENGPRVLTCPGPGDPG
ncbi:MAG: type I methionyl aminopeptidase [Candidatus Eisenbacteria sp.]|nr:type I methionyl aminopeptidase [Candidatus Eisenbacteria bacterium]